MSEEVLDFIHRRWKVDANWITGNCYWFAVILHTRFPDSDIYYLPVRGHFVVKIGSEFFDWTGVVVPKEPPLLFSEIEKLDSLWYSRLIRDCVN